MVVLRVTVQNIIGYSDVHDLMDLYSNNHEEGIDILSGPVNHRTYPRVVRNYNIQPHHNSNVQDVGDPKDTDITLNVIDTYTVSSDRVTGLYVLSDNYYSVILNIISQPVVIKQRVFEVNDTRRKSVGNIFVFLVM